MRKSCFALVGLVGLLVSTAPPALGQARPYIGFAYPAGGQQGTTFRTRLGGQGIDDLNEVLVSGSGVSARVIELHRRLNPQDVQLLREQLQILKRAERRATEADAKSRQHATRIEQRIAEHVQRPACAAIATVAIVEITVSPDAAPGPRELTLTTLRGVSNPLAFHVGQFPETSRKPMLTAHFQVLGKERMALRKRPDDEVEKRVTLPCTVNGQIASGEVNRYRFESRKGQRLVISAAARQLNPFVADAVPGWFQPVMTLRDADGREVAYNDDYRFRPDPVILCEIPKDGEYVLAITDAIHRGREDFVYRVTIGELPFIASIFPLGGNADRVARIEMKGWNLEGAMLVPPAANAEPGVHPVAAVRNGLVSNVLPFELGTLPERREREPSQGSERAREVSFPIVIDGRIDRAGDSDVFRFEGTAGQTIVADVDARRLDSPLDSFLTITDADGVVLAFNDDQEDPEAGSHTHDADSYLTLRLPADGTYYVHLVDTSRCGGEEYAYRLRISEPRPDFALRVVPTGVGIRGKGTAAVTVNVIRKDGFDGPVRLTLKDPPEGFSSAPVSLGPADQQAKLVLKTDRVDAKRPVTLTVQGSARIQDRVVTRIAVPAEDRMQAFLWRHLVPAEELKVLVFDPSYQAPPKRVARVEPPATAPATKPVAPADPAAAKPKFTRQQVAARLRQLKLLFEDELITEDFYHSKVGECEEAL
jgi:hypothetical protein